MVSEGKGGNVNFEIGISIEEPTLESEEMLKRRSIEEFILQDPKISCRQRVLKALLILKQSFISIIENLISINL
jgi:hypothetical protein